MPRRDARKPGQAPSGVCSPPDLVNNGLPIHIGAAVLGHLDLETTRGYVAVFDDEVTRHYQVHLQRRRALRPDHEYAPVTDQEWAEFDEHFDRREVELGGCGRPYATQCTHEHSTPFEHNVEMSGGSRPDSSISAFHEPEPAVVGTVLSMTRVAVSTVG